MVKMILFTKQKLRYRHKEYKHMDAKEGRRSCGKNGKIGVDIYTLYYIFIWLFICVY